MEQVFIICLFILASSCSFVLNEMIGLDIVILQDISGVNDGGVNFGGNVAYDVANKLC